MSRRWTNLMATLAVFSIGAIVGRAMVSRTAMCQVSAGRQAAGIEDPLSQPIARADLDDTTYASAIEYLQTLTASQIVVEWHELAKLEVTPATRLKIDLHLRNTTLRQVLEALCASYQPAHASIDYYDWVGFQYERGLIFLTRVHAGLDHPPFQTRVFDVTRLIEHPRFLEVVELQAGYGTSRNWNTDTPARRLGMLIASDLSEEGLDPRSDWQLRLFCGKLIATDTPEHLEQIESFLRTFEQNLPR